MAHMTGKAFLDKLEQAFPGVLDAFYRHHKRPTRRLDASVADCIKDLADRCGATITPGIVAKARLRHGVAAFRQPNRHEPREQTRYTAEHSARCFGSDHVITPGLLVCDCGGKRLPPRLASISVQPPPAPQALGPQARSLFEDREPETKPPIPEPKGLNLSDESAARVALHLYKLMQQNTGTSAEVGSNGAGAGVAS